MTIQFNAAKLNAIASALQANEAALFDVNTKLAKVAVLIRAELKPHITSDSLAYETKRDFKTALVAAMQASGMAEAAAKRSFDRAFATLELTVAKSITAREPKAPVDVEAKRAELAELQAKSVKAALTIAELAEAGKLANEIMRAEDIKDKAAKRLAKQSDSAATKAAKEAVLNAIKDKDTLSFITECLAARNAIEDWFEAAATPSKPSKPKAKRAAA